MPFYLPNDGNYTLSVSDVSGKQVYRTTASAIAGSHQVALEGAHFSAGLYYYTLEFEGQRITRRMVKL
ncbi:MAG: T9SS type A sorting domain-containing protein [Saprospiraceae bacterium]